MATLNKVASRPAEKNHEGVVAARISPEQLLRRSVMACLLWEDSFYEDGKTIAERIAALVKDVKPEVVAAIAVEARTRQKLRHVPLLIVREMARLATHKHLVAKTLYEVVQRPDELTEFCAIWQKDQGGKPLSKSLSAQAKKGLAAAFGKFDEYALAKYNRDGAVKLRDVLFLCHAKPKAEGAGTAVERKGKDGKARTVVRHEGTLLGKVVAGTLATPDTWEVALSGGADKKAAFERLMAEKKLGALAFVRNLRTMSEAKVDLDLVRSYAATVPADRVLPFRFVAAARAVPAWESVVEGMMLRCLAGQERLTGKTVLLIDTSPSMAAKLSAKSDLTRKDGAMAVAILLRELCDVEVVAFSQEVKTVPDRHGFALGDAIRDAVPSNGTLLGKAVAALSGRYDRLIVITDEESQDAVGKPDAGKKSYMVNVSTEKHAVGFGDWVRVNGWSEAIIDFIRVYEQEMAG